MGRDITVLVQEDSKKEQDGRNMTSYSDERGITDDVAPKLEQWAKESFLAR